MTKVHSGAGAPSDLPAELPASITPSTDPAEIAVQLTVGVEEEFLLVDGRSRRPAAAAPQVLASATHIEPELQHEITRFQVELTTPVCRSATELHTRLRPLRADLARVARQHGLRLLPSGTPQLGPVTPPPLADVARYHQIARKYGGLVDTHSICGCHVHVGIPDRDLAVQVSNHLRPWLPLLLALSANSPFWDQRDTQHASWRSVIWSRWPSAGPPPLFESAGHYDHTVQMLLDTGTILDRGMVYWDIRLSQHHPTLEVRVGDVTPTSGETALLAGVIRALTAVALAEVYAGRPAPPLPHHDLRAHLWRAAHDGLSGYCLHPRTGRLAPAWQVTQYLVQHTRRALAAGGDLPLVRRTLAALSAAGCGADRQRRAFARRGRLTDVVDAITAEAVADRPLPIPRQSDRGRLAGS